MNGSSDLHARQTVNDLSRSTVLLRKSKFKIPIHLHLSRLLAQAQHLRSVFKAALVAILRPVDRAQSSHSCRRTMFYTCLSDTQTNAHQRTWSCN